MLTEKKEDREAAEGVLLGLWVGMVSVLCSQLLKCSVHKE